MQYFRRTSFRAVVLFFYWTREKNNLLENKKMSLRDKFLTRLRPAFVVETEEEDVAIARKMFVCGLFLLPWIWILNALHFAEKFIFSEPSDHRRRLRLWIGLSCGGAALLTSLLIVWNVVFQLNWRAMKSLTVVNPEAGGWYDDPVSVL